MRPMSKLKYHHVESDQCLNWSKSKVTVWVINDVTATSPIKLLNFLGWWCSRLEWLCANSLTKRPVVDNSFNISGSLGYVHTGQSVQHLMHLCDHSQFWSIPREDATIFCSFHPHFSFGSHSPQTKIIPARQPHLRQTLCRTNSLWQTATQKRFFSSCPPTQVEQAEERSEEARGRGWVRPHPGCHQDQQQRHQQPSE